MSGFFVGIAGWNNPLGRRLAEHYSHIGNPVSLFDYNPPSEIPEYLRGMESRIGDARSYGEVSEWMKGCDIVVNLVRATSLLPNLYDETAALTLATACWQHQVSYVGVRGHCPQVSELGLTHGLRGLTVDVGEMYGPEVEDGLLVTMLEQGLQGRTLRIEDWHREIRLTYLHDAARDIVNLSEQATLFGAWDHQALGTVFYEGTIARAVSETLSARGYPPADPDIVRKPLGKDRRATLRNNLLDRTPLAVGLNRTLDSWQTSAGSSEPSEPASGEPDDGSSTTGSASSTDPEDS